MRDIVLEETIYMDFTTRAFSTGIPTVLSGTPVLSVLEENNATPITAGVSVSVDRASVVGLNMATIVATAANGYEAGKGYSIYVSTGTVGGVSVIGEVVAQFTIDASSATQELANGTDGLTALKTGIDAIPTTAMRGTDNAALASVCTETRLQALTDWLNGGRLDLLLDAIPTTAMRGTDSAALASVCTETRLQALTDWLDGGRLDLLLDAIPTTAMRGTDSAALASVCTETRLQALTDWLDGGRLDLLLDAIPTTAMRGTDSAALASVCTETRLAELDAANIPADIDAIPTTAMRGTDSALLAASINLTGGAVDNVTTVATTTTNTDMVAEPTTLLTTQMTEAYAADGTAPTVAQALFAIQQFLQERSTATTTVTVKKLDGSATAMTFTLDDATTPTSITRAT